VRDWALNPHYIFQSKEGTPVVAEQNAAYWGSILDRIASEQLDGLNELIDATQDGLRFLFTRWVGRVKNLDDLVNEVYTIAVQDIRSGAVPEPMALVGHLRTIANTVAERVVKQASDDCAVAVPSDTEFGMARRARTEAMVRALRGLSQRDRELARRFYDQGQTQEQICTEMKLTAEQFHTRKANVNAILSGAAQQAVSDPKPTSIMPIQFKISALRRLQ
jgi:DNA-directed RNA polymerase specialized sigma24 family protein